MRLPTLSFEIEADGTAAIQEINRVRGAVEGVSDSAQEAGTTVEGLGECTQETADGMSDMSGGAQDAARSVERLGSAAENTSGSLNAVLQNAEKIGSSMSKFITLPLTGLYTASVKGAADLVETVGKTEVVFGGFYDRVKEWSESSIATMGIAQSTALDMASLYGDMATGMGFAQESAADMAMELTRLAADMASFKNISIDVAQTALKSVFTGETESLKNLGVVMTQANLQAYALSQGIEKNIQDMTQAEQVTLRYNYVLAQTANAQGDFERTGDSLSNQSRKLTQTLKQMGESYGTLLIPNVTNVVEKLQSAAQWLAELDDGMKDTILTIGLVAAATGPILAIGSKIIQMIQGIKAAMAMASFGPTALAIAAAVAAAAGLVAVFRSTKKEVDETAESYQRVKRLLDKNLQTKVEVDSEELDNLEDKEITVSVTTTEEGPSENVKAFLKEVDELGWEAKDFSVTGSFEVSENTTEEIEAYALALANAATATGDYADAVSKMNELLDERYNARVQEILQQMTEEAKQQAILYNEGIIDEATYNANIHAIIDGAEEARRALNEEKEAAQEANDVLKNGKRGDDYGEYAQQNAKLYEGETLSTEDYKGAAAALQEAYESGADMTEQTTNAKVALEGLKTATVESYEEMIAAKEAYDKAMQTADDTEANAEAQERRVEIAEESAKLVQGMAIGYAPMAADMSTAIENMANDMAETEEEAAALKERLTELFTGEDGELVDKFNFEEFDQHVSDTMDALKQEAEKATEDAETLRTEAETQRTEAAKAFGTSMEEIQSAVGLTSEGMSGLLEIIKSAGVGIDAADAEMIASVQGMVEGMAAELENGSPEVANQVSNLIGAVGDKANEAAGEGKTVGAQITAGVERGLKSGTGSLYRTARQIVENTIREFKQAAQIQSPSKRMRDEVGKMLVRGIGVGAEDEMPSLLSGMKKNMDKVISGAQTAIGGSGNSAVRAAANKISMDYEKLRDVVKEAASEVKMSFSVGKRELATATAESNARAANARQNDLNIGKVRT